VERRARWWLSPEEETFRDGAAPVGTPWRSRARVRRVSQGDGSGQGPGAVTPRRAAWQASSPVLVWGDAAPRLEVTRHPVGDMAWKRSIRSVVETCHVAHARCIVTRTILPPTGSDNGHYVTQAGPDRVGFTPIPVNGQLLPPFPESPPPATGAPRTLSPVACPS
jgi:hypothetical protein